MQSAGCQVKITDTNHTPSKHWHPPPVGWVALSVDRSFSAANPLIKYQQLIFALFQGVLFSERSTNLFSLFVHSVTTLFLVQGYFQGDWRSTRRLIVSMIFISHHTDCKHEQMEDQVSAKLTLNPTAVVEMRQAAREPWRLAGKRPRAIRPPLTMGE